MSVVYLLEAILGAIPLQPQPVHEYFSASTVPAPSWNGQRWRARLSRPLSISTQIAFDTESGQLGGRAIPTFGEIQLENGDGLLDYLCTRRSWRQRELIVYRGQSTDPWANFVPIARIAVDDITWNAKTITVGVRDRAELLNVPAQPTLYAGTGGLEGGAELTGRPKPRLIGHVQNIEPVLVDRVNSIYQVATPNDTADNVLASEACAIFDKGIPMPPPQIVGSGSAAIAPTVTDWFPVAGQWALDPGRGLLRLGAPAAGTLTMDAQARSPFTPTSGPAHTIGQAMREVATWGGFTDADLDLASFAALDAVCGDTVGLYVTDANLTVASLLDTMAQQMPVGFWSFDGLGRLRVGQITNVTAAVLPALRKIVDAETIRNGNHVQRLRIGRNRTWRVQNADELAPASDIFPATDPRRALVGRDYQWSPSTVTSAIEPSTIALDVPTLAYDQAMMAGTGPNVRDWLVGLLQGSGHRRWQLTVRDEAFQHRVGDIVAPLYTPPDGLGGLRRWGLDGLKHFVVLRVDESAGTELTTLEVWG